MLLRLLVAVASVSIACSPIAALFEPSPRDLLQKANANFKSAKTAHVEGAGSFAIKDGLSISFDFKLSGDAESPDKSRLSIQMSLLRQSISVDTITVGGRTFTKGLGGNTWTEGTSQDPTSSMLDPLSQADLSAVVTVNELDRPEVDGHKTRHLAYTVDAGKLLERMKSSPASASFAPSNVDGRGEVWIRTHDSQIVRQLVKLSFEVDGGLGLPTGSSPSPTGKGTFEMSFDLKFTHIGEPISPAITAPPSY
ncbi:MAG TPA: hypothetical protein VGR87_05805 [Candidatus Limnocylindria bacterium]|nr:hypothetical protein [Candidatus Limnocylindria bacterium]